MSQICIYLELEDYLSQWFIHEQGGEVPVKLIRGSIESKLLQTFLSRRPNSVLPDCGGKGETPIAIPTFRNRPPEVYNYFPLHAAKSMHCAIRERFDIQIFLDLYTFDNLVKPKSDLLLAWMEKHGIEPNDKNSNAVFKRYQRQRGVYKRCQWSKENYKKKKSKKM